MKFETPDGKKMLRKRNLEIHKEIKERFGTNKLHDEVFSQKTYWESLFESPSGEGFIEPVEANPDIVGEDQALYSGELSDEAVFRLDVIKEAWPKLSEQQQRAVILCGEENKSLEDAAKIIGVTKRTVQYHLDEARKKIKKIYTVRKAEFGL